MVKLIRSVIECQDPDVIVLQLLDSSIYFARAADGSRMATVKLEDGRWHMVGAVTICSQEMQFEHFAALKLVLDVIGKRHAIIISPMPRYIITSCCNDPGHCVGRGSPDNRSAMDAALDSLKKNLKDFLFNTGRRNIKILDPSVDFRGMTDREIWSQDDPIHPRPEAYSKIAEGVIKLKALANSKTNKPDDYKRRRTDSFDTADTASGSGSGSRRRGDDSSYNRVSYGYRGNTTGWRGTPRSNGGRGRYHRGAAAGSNPGNRRGGGY
jgi:hypothetical protein